MHIKKYIAAIGAAGLSLLMCVTFAIAGSALTYDSDGFPLFDTYTENTQAVAFDSTDFDFLVSPVGEAGDSILLTANACADGTAPPSWYRLGGFCGQAVSLKSIFPTEVNTNPCPPGTEPNPLPPPRCVPE